MAQIKVTHKLIYRGPVLRSQMHEFVGEEKNDDAWVQCSLQLEKASDKEGWFDIHNSDMAKLGLSCMTTTVFAHHVRHLS
ncbi:hypothetical protein CIPAW_06G009300 [Carya illinoinensis]|uniref:Uncharacterized protein n=1 Tax=Carya illinoinensis TaxID=32201 RepID=A0A8T1Q5D8_CARIL|nr:hypothetical protein CIPAW_06G009300 [Carya illinoinensis]